jgi:PAS domain S-box-containing protein
VSRLERERLAIDPEGGLHMSPDLCRALFGQNPLPMWVFDVETLEFLDVNEAAVRHYGYSRAEFLAMRTADICSSDVADVKTDGDAGCRACGPVQTRQHRLKTGEIINSEIASHTVTFAGRPAILVSTHDVTDRVRTESERHLFAAIVEDCEDAIVGTVDGIVVSWNGAAAQVYGYTREEAIGQHLSRFIPVERAAELPVLLARLQRGERLAPYETERRRKDGSTVPVSLTLSPVRNAAGTVTGVSAICRDISERLRADCALGESEERMRFALDASGVGVWEANVTTNVAYWSETNEVMHGLAPGTFGRTVQAFVDCIHPDDRERVLRAIEEAKRAGTATEYQYRTISRDGTERWITSTAQFFYDEAGDPVRGTGVTADITERRLLEDQLRQAQKMEAVGQVAGGVAHDFNNMLTAILGNAELVLSDLPVDDTHRDNIEEIRSAGQRAAALTQQLLAFSRKQILTTRVIHLGGVVAGIIPLLRRLIGENIDLRAIAWNRGHVKADRLQLEQVLMNLAVNARDAMPDGGRLTIETADVVLDQAYAREYPYVNPGPYVVLTVSDTGDGMDAATRKRVFEPFFTTKPTGKGTGLGLATVYGIAKQSGGHIHVYSERGRGTTFKVYLPRTDEVDAVRQPASDDHRPLGGNGTILLVEDEDVVRKFAHRVLESFGYTVHASAGPQQAIEFANARAETIDLIVTDVVLPGMNGRAMATLLMQHHPESKVLYISGYADQAIVHHGVLDEGTCFLPKPFTAEALARSVRGVLQPQPA